MPGHWNCCVAGCYSNWSNWKRYHTVPRDPKIIRYYKAFLKTDGVNWSSKQNTCSKHWSVPRRNARHLPDIRIPTFDKEASHASSNALKKLAAVRLCKDQGNAGTMSGELDEGSLDILGKSDKIREKTAIRKGKRRRKDDHDLLHDHQNKTLRLQVSELEKRVYELETKNNELMERETHKIKSAELCVTSLFDFDSLNSSEIFMFTGQEKEDFDVIYRCFEPFIHLVKYEGCETTPRRKTSQKNELLAVFAICRHALPLSVAAWLLRVSSSTMSRIFEAWITFGDAVLGMLDLQPTRLLIKELIPDVYKKLGFSHISLVLDATEFKLAKFSDLNLNTLFFSDYKQTHTAKALVCLAPHGALTIVPDLYPGSISDTDITKITSALDACVVFDGVLTDKGFSISEIAAERGVEHNRPPMKTEDQFSNGECDDNFKIACLRIHVERWIGYLRNFRILNAVWACNRIDLLNSTWRFLAHIQAITTLVKPVRLL